MPPDDNDACGLQGDESTDEREDRVLAAVEACTAEARVGRRPTRREIRARYPDIAEDVSACLAGLAFVSAAGAEMGSNDSAKA